MQQLFDNTLTVTSAVEIGQAIWAAHSLQPLRRLFREQADPFIDRTLAYQ
ncbi:MAG TPA: hypothetical protein VNK49_09175 [Anaerolineales bacterium]|nr:hypothetical protein [Anaerolineales bacterium]